VPSAFWWFSIGGGICLLAYALYRRDPVFIVGQSAGLVVYARNMVLRRREKAAPAAVTTPSGATRPSMLSRAWQTVKPGWKGKALGLGALAGTGYVGYKGLQTARDYMMMPTYTSQAWGGYGAGPAHQVGPYGYAPHMG